MTDEEAVDAELERRLDAKPEGFEGCEGCKTWREVFDYMKTTFYIGSTWQPIEVEGPHFFTRKTYLVGGKPRVFAPMITHPDGRRIKVSEAANTEAIQQHDGSTSRARQSRFVFVVITESEPQLQLGEDRGQTTV
jgi:hypothetical protein